MVAEQEQLLWRQDGKTGREVLCMAHRVCYRLLLSLVRAKEGTRQTNEFSRYVFWSFDAMTELSTMTNGGRYVPDHGLSGTVLYLELPDIKHN